MASTEVSVMMPAYNAGKTILKALRSLQNQTFKAWECIVVDDGSTDDTAAIVVSISDERIKLIQLEKNMGRGYARQVALENSKGKYIAMLDADDWYYSSKLSDQVEVFKLYPDLAIVSCGMALTNIAGEIIGVRCLGDNTPKLFEKPTTVPVPHAPSMYKKEIATNIQYDKRFKLAQDVDFLRRALLGKHYVLIDKIGYVYEEQQSNSSKKVLQGYYYSARGYLKFLTDFPALALFKSVFEIAKIMRVIAYVAVGKFDSLIASRSIIPTSTQQIEFNEQQRKLGEKL